MNRLAISTYSLWRWRKEEGKSAEQAMEWIASTGVGGVEIVGGEGGRKGARRLRRVCQGLGLKVAGYCVKAELLATRAMQRQVVEELKRQVEWGVELGAGSIRHDVTQNLSKMRDGEVISAVVPAIREVADFAQSLGVKTSLENHGFYLQRPALIERLIKAVEHPNFGLTLDIGNFLCLNVDPVMAVKRLAPYAVMVHAKDFHVRAKNCIPPVGWFKTPKSIALRGAIIGHGVIDIPGVFRVLRDCGYKGYVSVEFEGMEEPTMAILQGVNYLTKCI